MLENLFFREGSSQKFWTIFTNGPYQVVRYGKIGTNGRSSEKEADDEASSIAAAEKLAASKRKKGYADEALFETDGDVIRCEGFEFQYEEMTRKSEENASQPRVEAKIWMKSASAADLPKDRWFQLIYSHTHDAYAEEGLLVVEDSELAVPPLTALSKATGLGIAHLIFSLAQQTPRPIEFLALISEEGWEEVEEVIEEAAQEDDWEPEFRD